MKIRFKDVARKKVRGIWELINRCLYNPLDSDLRVFDH
jgi:hypothetical protein